MVIVGEGVVSESMGRASTTVMTGLKSRDIGHKNTVR